MTENQRELTAKEQKVIAAFDSARPGLGAMAEKNIRANDSTGWADLIADDPNISDDPNQELIAGEGFGSNSFLYPRIGG